MKTVGAVIVAVSSALCGYVLSRRLSFAADTCEELLRIMKYVRDEIAVNKTPTHIILSRLRSSFDLSCASSSGLYSAVLPQLQTLSSEEKEIFFLFCEQIGKGGAEVQRTQFDALIGQLEEKAQKRRSELSKNRRLCISLSLFFGVLIIIIMI